VAGGVARIASEDARVDKVMHPDPDKDLARTAVRGTASAVDRRDQRYSRRRGRTPLLREVRRRASA
jgi:hypothetical protein